MSSSWLDLFKLGNGILFGLSSVLFLQFFVVWPVALHKKQVILSSVKKILNCDSFIIIINEFGSFGMSSCLMNYCLRKLIICSYPSIFIPALR